MARSSTPPIVRNGVRHIVSDRTTHDNTFTWKPTTLTFGAAIGLDFVVGDPIMYWGREETKHA